ncbi:transmembrane 6 superfamily member 2-like [Conger conger]|uniref:transmembrane 6 superfamily member 2-like n=1 Tax=Conger conger TaxID=82655 RepID=UPI002A5A1622|nr:transmembrane 6 superfamily member 2-like [Conger conger]
MNIPQEICVYFFSLSALLVLYTMNNVPVLQHPQVIPVFGVAVMLLVFLAVRLAVRHRPPKDPLFYVYVEFSFTCVISLVMALEQEGYTSGFMGFYQKTGEPYIVTAYAIMMAYWDGIVHFLLYLFMVQRMANGTSCRGMGLFWAGSLLANMTVYVPGITIGKYAVSILPTYWLNFPFLFGALWGAVSLFNRPRELPIIPADRVAAEQRRSLLSRPLDLLLVLFLVTAMGFTIFRGIVVLDCPLDSCFTYIYQYEPYLKDPVGFPRFMMLLYLFYGLPLLALLAYGLWTPGCTWMLDCSMLLAGAIAQCQWCHTAASLHRRTPFTYRVPEGHRVSVVALNVLYGAGPLLLALRCVLRPAFFLKAVPQGQANHEKKND